MPRKQAGAQKNGTKPATQPAGVSDASISGTNAGPGAANAGLGAGVGPGAAAAGAPTGDAAASMPFQSWKFKLIFLIVPIIQMLFSAEAPRRPFSAVRSRQTGELQTTAQGEPVMIDPRILFVASKPSDVLYFSPTITSLLSTDKKETNEVFLVSLSTGEKKGNEAKDEWEGLWDVLGLEEEKRVLLDVPLLEASNPNWDAKDVAQAVVPFITQFSIDTILTFDATGPSEDPHHATIHSTLSSLVIPSKGPISSLLSTAISKLTTPNPIYPRLFELVSPPLYTQYLGVASPIVEHFTLVYRSLFGGKSKSAEDGEGEKKEVLPPATTIINDVKGTWKGVKAVTQLKSELQLPKALQWCLERGLWVNVWKEVTGAQ